MGRVKGELSSCGLSRNSGQEAEANVHLMGSNAAFAAHRIHKASGSVTLHCTLALDRLISARMARHPVTIPSLPLSSSPDRHATVKARQDRKDFEIADTGPGLGENIVQTLIGPYVQNALYVFRAERMNVGECGIAGGNELTPNAGNLASVLLQLDANPIALERFKNYLRTLYPSSLHRPPRSQAGHHGEWRHAGRRPTERRLMSSHKKFRFSVKLKPQCRHFSRSSRVRSPLPVADEHATR
jgi:hypothetical protein